MAILAPELIALAHEQHRREQVLGPTVTAREGSSADIPTWSGAFEATIEDILNRAIKED